MRRCRAVAVSEGRTIGRAQARISPIGGSRRPARPADARADARADPLQRRRPTRLWRLTGIELLDLSGPAAIGADMRGTLAESGDQRLGADRRRAARKRGDRHGDRESGVGRPVRRLAAADRRSFSGTHRGRRHRLRLGRARFRRRAAASACDFDVRAENARLLDRDDIQAAVTGDLAIRSDGEGGSISGDVRGELRAASGSAAPPRRRRSPRLNVARGQPARRRPRAGGAPDRALAAGARRHARPTG